MKKFTKLGVQWFYNLLEIGECEYTDFKEQLDEKQIFGRSHKSFSGSYRELAKDVVAFANYKGGFIVIGIVDKDKAINADFSIDQQKKFDLIKNLQDLTRPSITVVPHDLVADGTKLLVLEIPFSNEVHCTSKGEYLIRNFDGNKILEPHELVTVLAEKKQIIYDQKTWRLDLLPSGSDKQGEPIPGWQNIEKTRALYGKISKANPNSPYLKKSLLEFTETLGLVKEENQEIYPTTTGLLFIGSQKAQREFPYNLIKYIRYKQDGTYTPYEFKGDLLQIADESFQQLKSEINLTEFRFGLFREYIEDYPEVVLRELLINAIAHRDYSRQAYIEIRKYDHYIEFESPGGFPDGITIHNYLRKSNPRNPYIMDILRETKYAEKAGSGFDKIFTELLMKGKSLPVSQETENSLIFRVSAETFSEQLIQLSFYFKELFGHDMDLEKLLVLDAICRTNKITLKELEESPHISKVQLKRILRELQDIEFIETTGKTSGLKYLIHKSKLISAKDERTYILNKQQTKQKQIEVILRYLNEFEEIDNEKAREVLVLPDSKISDVSRLFKEMLEKNLIKVNRRGRRKTFYSKKN
ncbi:MAG: putative DNA binding domain-containing protein [Lewinellaceae bacterium]|nr:putative DNA binding domain-containing protein [Lewinellaceae bacterium]